MQVFIPVIGSMHIKNIKKLSFPQKLFSLISFYNIIGCFICHIKIWSTIIQNKKGYCSGVSWTWENRWCRLIIVNAIGFLIQIFWTLCQIYLLVLPVASKQACSCINQNAWILLFSAMPFMSWPSTGFPSCFSLLFAIFFCRMLLKKD